MLGGFYRIEEITSYLVEPSIVSLRCLDKYSFTKDKISSEHFSDPTPIQLIGVGIQSCKSHAWSPDWRTEAGLRVSTTLRIERIERYNGLGRITSKLNETFIKNK